MTYQLSPTSDEQKLVVEHISSHNVIVNSMAGAGKTTTVLHIGQTYKWKILLLTYNAKLKIESREKCKDLRLSNVEVHSYHAFCVRYYDKKCHTDKEIRNILRHPPQIKFDYDLIIIDEAQDMTLLYYELLCNIVASHKVRPKICVLGDVNQSIFQFNGADPRFMNFHQLTFSFNDHPWINLSLNTTFRLTNQMTQFINDCVYRDGKMKALKDGAKVRYYICDVFGNDDLNIPFSETIEYLKEYDYEDILILAPSIKTPDSPVRRLANLLTSKRIPIYVPNNDDEKIDNEIIQGKILFSTFHQIKGLERKVSMVFNFDKSYFDFFNRTASPTRCSNELYVAISRAKEKMTLLHHNQNAYLPFLELSKLRNLTEFKVFHRLAPPREAKLNEKNIGVTDLIKHLSNSVLTTAMGYIKTQLRNDAEKRITIDTKTKQGELYESVSEITGTAIASYFEYHKKGTMSIHETLRSAREIVPTRDTDEKYSSDIEYNEVEEDILSEYNTYSFTDCDGNIDAKDVDYLDDDDLYDISRLTPAKLLKISNRYCAFMTGYYYKLNQISSYDWLTKDHLQICTSRLKQQISDSAKFEKITRFSNEELRNNNKLLIGSVDCIDGDNIWEFKCVEELKDEHFIQLAIYAFMLNHANEEKKRKELEKLDAVPKIGKVITIKHNNRLTKGKVTKVEPTGLIHVLIGKRTVKQISTDEIVRSKRYDERKQRILTKYTKPYRYYLLNILTNEKHEILASYESLKQMVEYIIHEKYSYTDGMTDEEFNSSVSLAKCRYIDKEQVMLPLQAPKRNGSYIVLDIETDGHNKIIEIAYDIYDKDLNLVKRSDHLLNDGSGATDYYNRISIDEIEADGLPPRHAMEMLLNDMNSCSYIVGHNIIRFDIEQLQYYFDKFGIYCEFPTALDTMTTSKRIVNAKNKRGALKMPKLSELYQYLFNQSLDESKAHRGSYDVEVTFQCFQKLMELNVFELI
jgi:hypothetical protein